MLHTDADLSIAVKSSVEAHYVGGVTLMQHLKLPDDLVPDCGFDFKMNELEEKRVDDADVHFTQDHCVCALLM